MSKAQREAAEDMLRGAEIGGAVAELRTQFEARAQAGDAAGLAASEVTLGGRPAIELSPGDPAAGTLLYFHGGGFVVGSHRTGVKLAAAIARRAGLRAYSLDYRLAPDHPFPAAQLDGLAAYRDLLDRGVAPERITLAGDSAGGALAVQTLMAARDAGLPMPASVVVFSPWADPTDASPSMTAKHGVDPLFTRASLDWFRGHYLGDGDRLAPLANPALAGDLRGLPPVLIQVGSHEVLLDDSVRLAGRLGEADVDVTLEVVASVPHVFQEFTGFLDEADAALDRVAAFLTARIGAAA
jgi:epsilon-lactone hydrolase